MACGYERKENIATDGARLYSIDPKSIMGDLDNGKEPVFTPSVSYPTALPDDKKSPVSVYWGQEDYLRIVRALFKENWKESFDAQNIYSMMFMRDCGETEPYKFSSTDFVFYRNPPGLVLGKRIEYLVQINQTNNMVSATQAEDSPNINKYAPVNLKRYRIPAEQALGIAEKNGGLEVRQKNANDCTIIVYTNGSDDKDWAVSYMNRRNGPMQSVFIIHIDPSSGATEVIIPAK
jgi:hypothetical protein